MIERTELKEKEIKETETYPLSQKPLIVFITY